jgi:tRNA dimethylallyltransferase
MSVKTLITLVGPTAVGKTATSLLLARALNGEIVSADSRQAYRGMDIGTAKITPDEMGDIPHHLIDIREPDESISLGEYKELADAAIEDVMARGRMPLLVGGTGQYVRAVIEGWQIPRVPPQPELRRELEDLAAREGKEALFARLQELDPASAQTIDYRNLRRVIRAIEVTLVAGRPFSELQTKQPPPWRIVQLGLTRPREALYARTDARIEAMFAAGWVDEVRTLLARGYSPDLSSFASLGYREVAAYLAGEYDLEEAKMLIRRATRNFIRRQYNWFRLSNPDIRWFDLEETGPEEVLAWARRAF